MPEPGGLLVTPVGVNKDGYPRALTLLWGYSRPLRARVIDTNAAAGSDLLVGANCPSDRIWVVNSIYARDLNTANVDIYLGITDGVTYLSIMSQQNCPASHGPSAVGWFVVAEGWAVYAYFNGTIAGDDIYLEYTGHQMDL